MNKRQAKPDGYAGKSNRRAFRGGADDDVQEEESGDDFTQEAVIAMASQAPANP